MATRTIRTGLGTYQRPDGEWTHGAMGDEVSVHKDDLARFDRLNLPELQVLEAALAEEAAAALAVEEAEAARLAAEQQAQADAAAKAEKERFDAAVQAAVEKHLAEQADSDKVGGVAFASEQETPTPPAVPAPKAKTTAK